MQKKKNILERKSLVNINQIHNINTAPQYSYLFWPTIKASFDSQHQAMDTTDIPSLDPFLGSKESSCKSETSWIL